MKWILCTSVVFASGLAQATISSHADYLIQVKPAQTATTLMRLQAEGATTEALNFNNWYRVTYPDIKASGSAFGSAAIASLSLNPAIIQAQPNYRIQIKGGWQKQDAALLDHTLEARVAAYLASANAADGLPNDLAVSDNPAIPAPSTGGSGTDPKFSNQWGMRDIGVTSAWQKTKGSPNVIVAVIDTGVDYTHEDLKENLWYNPGETGRDASGRDKGTNGVDDDANGYIDDIIGWDFSQNDNKPFDMPATMMDMLFKGGNPGHGTHCAGNIAARSDNGVGIAGVAPNVKIMSLRFISTEGQGTTADAIKAIKYAVDMGAAVTSNSWGSEGAEEGDNALRDMIAYSQQKGVLFVAAAGNGHEGVGYNNDTDAKPGFPASYDTDIIVSVAAIDEKDALGAFSNWGVKSVDVGAPGVKVFSTTVGSLYSDTVIDIPGLITATWDGTSMATPHVAGAAALYISAHPQATWQEVKQALIASAKAIPSLNGKVTSNGKLDVAGLLR